MSHMCTLWENAFSQNPNLNPNPTMTRTSLGRKCHRSILETGWLTFFPYLTLILNPNPNPKLFPAITLTLMDGGPGR